MLAKFWPIKFCTGHQETIIYRFFFEKSWEIGRVYQAGIQGYGPNQKSGSLNETFGSTVISNS